MADQARFEFTIRERRSPRATCHHHQAPSLHLGQPQGMERILPSGGFVARLFSLSPAPIGHSAIQLCWLRANLLRLGRATSLASKRTAEEASLLPELARVQVSLLTTPVGEPNGPGREINNVARHFASPRVGVSSLSSRLAAAKSSSNLAS